MPQRFTLLYGILFLLLLPSCLTIEEHYEFKNNGSGSMRYIVDLSGISGLVDMGQDRQGRSFVEQLDFADAALRLEGVKGLSQISVIDESANYRYGVSFHFKNLQSLNEGLFTLLISSDNPEPATFFSKEDNVLTRNGILPANEISAGLMEENGTSSRARELMSRMSYKLSFKFARPIRAIYAGTPPLLIGKKAKKEAIVEASFLQISKDPEILETTLVLK